MRLLLITFLVQLSVSVFHLHANPLTSALIAPVSEVGKSLFTDVDFTKSNDLFFAGESSNCTTNEFAQQLQLLSSSSIVVVDIIPAYNISDPGATRSHGSHATSEYEPYDKVTLELDINDPGQYHISGITTGTNSVAFDFTLTYLPNGDLMVGNSLGNPSNFDIVGDGPAFGKFQASGSSNWGNLFKIENDWGKSGGIDAVITWLEEIDATITYASNYGQGNPQSFAVNPNTGATATQDILPEVYPNPVQDILHWNAPSSGHLAIYDMAGRQWFEGEITEEDHSLAQISVANWPSGSYILRWTTTENIPQTKHFVKTQ